MGEAEARVLRSPRATARYLKVANIVMVGFFGFWIQ
jgi:hypothetical protein